MSPNLKLPEKIKGDISIYLAPEEKLLKAVSSLTTGTGQNGQVWLILTSHSIFFHTCQAGKEPVIALIERKALREIEYFQRPEEIVLTFVPVQKPQNTTRLPFSIEKRAELEDFCEDLADLISFKKETQSGVKTYTTPVRIPESSKTPTQGEDILRNAASATRINPAIQKAQTPPVKPLVTEVEKKPEVKIVDKPTGLQTPKENPLKTPTTNTSKPSDGDDFKVSYIIAATFISVIVGFIWYQFFRYISRRN